MSRYDIRVAKVEVRSEPVGDDAVVLTLNQMAGMGWELDQVSVFTIGGAVLGTVTPHALLVFKKDQE